MNAEHNQMGQAGSLAEQRNGFSHEVRENAENGAERSHAKAAENAKDEKNAEVDLASESAEPAETGQNQGLAGGDARPPELAGSQPAIRQIGNLRYVKEDAKTLLDELTETLRRFVVLPAHAAETLALWILHTYAFELRKVTTYIG